MNQIVSDPQPVKKREFISYIHHFRGLAIIFVVAGHLLLDWPDDSPLYRFFRVFWENGTVLFIFIAGYLFQYLSKKFVYKPYLITKLKNVIVPYLIISIPIIIFRIVKNDYPGYLLAVHPDFADWQTWKKIFFFYTHGSHMQQLWFVPMITLFYLIAPLLMYIDKHPRLYLLLLIFIPVSFYFERGSFVNILQMFVHFFSVYLFGMFMSRYRNEYLELAKRFWVLLSVVTVAMIVLNYIYIDQYNGSLNYIQKMLFCCFFIYWLWRGEKYVPKFFSELADLSFGIFFVHYYILLVIKAIYEKVFHHPIPGNLVYWIVYLILVLAGSVVFIKLAKKVLTKNSRYIIGC